jgi:hypothetical protein
MDTLLPTQAAKLLREIAQLAQIGQVHLFDFGISKLVGS